LRLAAELSKKLSGILLPSKIFTGDNAAMIAVAAYFRTLKNKSVKIKNLEAMGNLKL
jgi:tRNA A37 threonylcarbamoyltransferase TsaD